VADGEAVAEALAVRLAVGEALAVMLGDEVGDKEGVCEGVSGPTSPRTRLLMSTDTKNSSQHVRLVISRHVLVASVYSQTALPALANGVSSSWPVTA
jgi:hypothetical protein